MTESSLSTDASRSGALDLARRALAHAPAGLLTDFDGTLSPIVRDPFLARMVDGVDGALAALARRLEVVAIITGRAPLDARRLIGVPGLLIAGNHGTEWLEPAAAAPASTPAAERIRAALAETLHHVAGVPGASVEDKGLSATVHYRSAPDPTAARAAILAAVGAVPEGVELREGRMSVELRPIELGDKGTAARAVIERFGLRGVVVMGDDVTDLDMFRVVATLRHTGRVKGAIIGVGSPDREVPAAVLEAADVALRDPHEVAGLLAGLADD